MQEPLFRCNKRRWDKAHYTQEIVDGDFIDAGLESSLIVIGEEITANKAKERSRSCKGRCVWWLKIISLFHSTIPFH